MALTLAQAKSLRYGQELHYTGPSRTCPFGSSCARTIGPRGGVAESVVRVRVSGSVKVWKRSPERVEVPVKYGMYESGRVTESNLDDWHLAADCPLNRTDGPVPAIATAEPLGDTMREILEAREVIEAAAAMIRRRRSA
jgi:hypothetical protein